MCIIHQANLHVLCYNNNASHSIYAIYHRDPQKVVRVNIKHINHISILCFILQFAMHQPSKIPSEMWQVFEQIDDIKDKITNSNAGNITAELQGDHYAAYNVHMCMYHIIDIMYGYCILPNPNVLYLCMFQNCIKMLLQNGHVRFRITARSFNFQ